MTALDLAERIATRSARMGGRTTLLIVAVD
jgi:hypothetical protein